MKAKLFSVFAVFTGILSMAILLVGCTTGLSPERYLENTREFMVSQGKPPAYVEGYMDGCSTGRRMGGDTKFHYKRNNARADRDALYARGWQDGQISCRNEVIAEEQSKCKEGNNGGFIGTNIEDERRRRIEAQSRSDAETREIWEQLRK